jgi:hypothetical protein
MYLVGIGHDVAPEDLATLDPQPRCPGKIPTRRQNGISGRVLDEAPYLPFYYDVIPDGPEYRAILAQWGLSSDNTAEVSIAAIDENYDDAVYNGIAVKPELGTDGQRDNFFLRGFVIRVHTLQDQA